MATDNAELLSRKEVASILGVSEFTVRNLVKRKELRPGVKVAGKMVRWFRRDVNEYLGWLAVSERVSASQKKSRAKNENP